MDIGNRIKARREELGMSQDELANKMGYKTRSTIAKIESGANKVTTVNAQKLANVLNTSLSYIMGWNSDELLEIEINAKRDANLLTYAQRLSNYVYLNDEDKKTVENMINYLYDKSKGDDK